MGTHASVDARVEDVGVVVVEDVAGAETDGRRAAVDVVPAVVGVGDMQMAGVFGAVGVGVAYQGGFVLLRG